MNMMDRLNRLWAALTSWDDEGQGLLEYALIISFVAIVVFGALTLFGTKIAVFYNTAGNSL